MNKNYDVSLFPYEWKIEDGYPAKNIEKNNLKVFSCFACGGGSTMGYKLAGYDVIGCNEIDKKLIELYKTNHNPKYAFCEPIQTFKDRDDLPEDLYNLDILDGSPPCFVGDTLVMTLNGYKEIKDVTINDHVLTHTNKFQQVITTMSKNVDNIVKLSIQGSLPIYTTKEHPFYSIRMNRNNKSNARNFSNPNWVNVENLSIIRKGSSIKEQDYIGVPINMKSDFPIWEGVYKNNKINNTLDFTNKNLWYLIGRWFGDGWIRFFENDKKYRYTDRYVSEQKKCLNCDNLSRKHERYEMQWTNFCSESCRRKYKIKNRKPNRYSFIICCGKHEFEELKSKIENYTENYTITEERTTFKFHINSKELCKYMKQFNHGAKNKRITSDILNLPIEYIKIFLDGYLDADGHLDKLGKFHCTSISRELIYGLQALIYKAYKTPTTITKRKNNDYSYIENRKVNVNISYNLSFFKEKRKQQHGFYKNNFMWLPFRNKEIILKDKKVYNLSVNIDESYTVFNYSVHNCSSFSMAGNREKDWGKNKVFREGQSKQVLDTLFFDFIDLANKLKPKVVIAENVKGLLLGNAKKYVNRILKEFDNAGYYVEYFLLDASNMGVPQKRERVFFIAIRKDLLKDKNYKYLHNELFSQNPYPYIDMKFNQKPIIYRDIRNPDNKEENLTEIQSNLWKLTKPGKSFSTSHIKGHYFNDKKLDIDKVPPTIISCHIPFDCYVERGLSHDELCKAGSFPSDYNKVGIKSIIYIVGMSVPPVMIANIAHRVKKHIFDAILNKGCKQ